MRNLVAQREVAVTASYYQPVPDIGRGGEQQHTWVYFDDEQLTHTKTTAMKASERDLEVGAESWCKWFLPFKKDGVLRSGTFQRRRKFGRLEADRVVTLDEFIKEQKTTVPWLSRNPYCVVRVEALDEEPARLDRWVYEEARKAKFQDIWTEDEASRAVGELYVRHGIDYQANPNFTDP